MEKIEGQSREATTVRTLLAKAPMPDWHGGRTGMWRGISGGPSHAVSICVHCRVTHSSAHTSFFRLVWPCLIPSSRHPSAVRFRRASVAVVPPVPPLFHLVVVVVLRLLSSCTILLVCCGGTSLQDFLPHT